MRKIKRTITVRKVEFISNKNPDHELNVEICPLCHSQIHVLAPANNSAVDQSAAEIPLQVMGKSEIVIKGDKND